MAKKNTFENYLSLEVVSEMLCSKLFSVKAASIQGCLPKIIIKKNNGYFKKNELASHFGLDKFDEPFITLSKVIEITGLSKSRIENAYSAELNPLPSYQLVQEQGSKKLFLESQVKGWYEIKIHQDVAHGVFASKYKMLTENLENTLNACWDIGGLSYKEYLVLNAVLIENKTLNEIRDTNRPALDALIATGELSEAARHEFAENHLDPTLTSARINNFLNSGFRKVKQFTLDMVTMMKKYEELEALVINQALVIQEKDQILTAHGVTDTSIVTKKLRDIPEMGIRELNSLKSIGIVTLGALVEATKDQLSNIPRFGKKGLEKINQIMLNYNYPEK